MKEKESEDRKMIKATYLMDVIYFDSFDEVKKYYVHEEAEDIDELNEILKKNSMEWSVQ